MGGEVTLLMYKGETRKLREYCRRKFQADGPNLFMVVAPQLDPPHREIGCWIEFRGGAKVDVGYQASDLASEWAIAVANGIKSLFKIQKGGWNSVGYSPEFFNTRPFQAIIEMMEEVSKKHPEYETEYKTQIQDKLNYQKVYEDYIKTLFT